MRDLSVIVPSRNEMFLARTIEDALQNIEADTEIVALLDGQEASPPVPVHERVSTVYVNKSVGQRAGANLAADLSTGRYIMKVDAHCSFDKGFDRKMLEAFQQVGDNTIIVPIMRNLHAFNWRCYENYCGWYTYQSPTPEKCPKCGSSRKIRREMKWIGKQRPQSTSYCFDSEPHFQYFNEYTKRDEYKKMRDETGLTHAMSLQGSCFMLTREKYYELDICGESLGNWGNQGLEVACKMWLSGGQVFCNHKTWYAHMFRTQGLDFGFPYPLGGRETQRTKENVKNVFWRDGFKSQVYPISWLVEKFQPVPGWSAEDLASLKVAEFKPSGSNL